MKRCKHNANEVRWHDVVVDGKDMPIGGKASNDKMEIAYALKHTNYFNGFYNNKSVFVRSYNHCFICGFPNDEVITEV